jgi:hypothetical protein
MERKAFQFPLFNNVRDSSDVREAVSLQLCERRMSTACMWRTRKQSTYRMTFLSTSCSVKLTDHNGLENCNLLLVLLVRRLAEAELLALSSNQTSGFACRRCWPQELKPKCQGLFIFPVSSLYSSKENLKTMELATHRRGPSFMGGVG